LGEEGSIPQSPTGYRLLSVLVAVPFYHAVPLFKFTYLEGKSDIYLKALEALSVVTYLAVSIAAFLIYKITSKRFNGQATTSILAACIALLLFRFTAIYGVDPTAIMLICLLIYYLDKKWIFGILLILSIGFNEKICFLFVMLFGARVLFRQPIDRFYVIISLLAFLAYFFLRAVVDLPGYEHMVAPKMFVEKAMHTIQILFSAKSFFLNWLPGLLTFTLYYWARKEVAIDKNKNELLFSKVDFIPLVGFFFISIVTDMQYTIGRILLFCFPLYLPLAACYIERFFLKIKIRN
jgi:hypothetical protein